MYFFVQINVTAGLKQEAEETVKGHDDGSRQPPTNGSNSKSFTVGSAGSGGAVGGRTGTRVSFVGAANAVIAGRGTSKSTRFSVGLGSGMGSGGGDDSERRITAARTMSGDGKYVYAMTHTHTHIHTYTHTHISTRRYAHDIRSTLVAPV